MLIDPKRVWTDDTHPEPTALLLIDVGRFKAINDTYPHSAGDRVLREIAMILRANCRAGDTAVRYAGNEFVVFLRTALAGALHVAERIRATVPATRYADIAVGLRGSISVGAVAHRPGMLAREPFNAADANLYQAKRGGRDQIAT